MPPPNQVKDQFWSDDQRPDSPCDRYKGNLDPIGALERHVSIELVPKPIGLTIQKLKLHPDREASTVGALEMWAFVIPSEFETVDDATYDEGIGWMQIIRSRVAEKSDNIAFSSKPFVNFGQQLYDGKPGIATLHSEAVARRSVPTGILAFIDREKREWHIIAEREIGGLFWIRTLLQLAALVVKKLIIFNALNRVSERNSFSPGA